MEVVMVIMSALIITIIVQFISYLFICKLNIPEASYKVHTNKEKRTTKRIQIKHKNKDICVTIMNNNNNSLTKTKAIIKK
jgi:hypothetical protein